MADLILSEFPLIIGLLTTGALAGFLAGLLGVGGGIVIVPVLFTVLGAVGMDLEVRLHIAVGTSLATIIPTSISSIVAHHKRGAVDWLLFRIWSPGIVVGVVLGTWLATTRVSGPGLALVFAIVALVVAVDLLIRDRSRPVDKQTTEELNHLWFYNKKASWVPAIIGALSSMMGIGGGTLSVPFLNAVGCPMHRAVATSAGFGLIIAIPASAGYIIGGWDATDLPYASIGYVNVLGFLIITVTTVITAPLGSRVAHALKPQTLRLLFSGFLFVTSVRMLIAVY